jgi:hypothetical protein
MRAESHSPLFVHRHANSIGRSIMWRASASATYCGHTPDIVRRPRIVYPFIHSLMWQRLRVVNGVELAAANRVQVCVAAYVLSHAIRTEAFMASPPTRSTVAADLRHSRCNTRTCTARAASRDSRRQEHLPSCHAQVTHTASPA